MIVGRLAVLIMATIAEVVRAEAVKKCDLATVHTFPVNLLFAVFLAVVKTGTISFHLAVFAAQILFLGMLFDTQLLLAVDHASKVGLLAVKALIEGAGMEGKFEQLSFVVVTRGPQALIFVKALIHSDLQSLFFDLTAKLLQLSKFFADQVAASLFDLLLAAWARHEGKGDLQSIPLVLE
mmetsp:Transcript_46748/g.61839  ORF Transcript_46748/g.61839 Transcript_46748/m.61839 type:complete len:180 (+) Transcript_46748:907-1446(+)